jgi:excisionase family DNA binding protein
MELVTGATPRLITTSEAAELLKVSQRTVLNWIERGSIPYLELPSSGERPTYRIPLQGLLSSLAGNYDLESELRRLDEAAQTDGLQEADVEAKFAEAQAAEEAHEAELDSAEAEPEK